MLNDMTQQLTWSHVIITLHTGSKELHRINKRVTLDTRSCLDGNFFTIDVINIRIMNLDGQLKLLNYVVTVP